MPRKHAFIVRNRLAADAGRSDFAGAVDFASVGSSLGGRSVTSSKEALMTVTYPADAAAATYLLTVRGKVNTPTAGEARALHNATAGSPEGVAAALALGDLSHNVYTSAGGGVGADELLFIDYWNSPTGLGQFFADPNVQAGAAELFADREGVLWAPTTGFGDFHLALPAGKSVAAVGLLRVGVISLEAAAAGFNAYAAATINAARRYGLVAHTTRARLANPGETAAPEVLSIDAWSDLDQMNAYYELGLGFDHLGRVFAGDPQTSVWRTAAGEWVEW
jgi:hypothetical protein